MKLIPLIATKETIDVKRGGVITYDTGLTEEAQGIILLENPDGDYGVTIVNQVHPGGIVRVIVRPAGPTPVKKYEVGDIVGQLAVF